MCFDTCLDMCLDICLEMCLDIVLEVCTDVSYLCVYRRMFILFLDTSGHVFWTCA